MSPVPDQIQQSRFVARIHWDILVPGVGIEPTRPFWDLGILSPVRLPVSPPRPIHPSASEFSHARSSPCLRASMARDREIRWLCLHRQSQPPARAHLEAALLVERGGL